MEAAKEGAFALHVAWEILAEPGSESLSWRRAACREDGGCAPSEREAGGVLRLLQRDHSLAVPPGSRGAVNAYASSTGELSAAVRAHLRATRDPFYAVAPVQTQNFGGKGGSQQLWWCGTANGWRVTEPNVRTKKDGVGLTHPRRERDEMPSDDINLLPVVETDDVDALDREVAGLQDLLDDKSAGRTTLDGELKPPDLAANEIETTPNPAWKAGERESPHTPPPTPSGPHTDDLVHQAGRDEITDQILITAEETQSSSIRTTVGNDTPAGVDLEYATGGDVGGRTALAASRIDDSGTTRYAEVEKTFVVIETVAVLEAPEREASTLAHVEAGGTFIACGEITVPPANLPQHSPPQNWLDHPQTMLQVRLEQHGISPIESQSVSQIELGWIAEEDVAGSVVCLDLGRCLKPPIGNLCRGRGNRFCDGYYRVQQIPTRQPGVYPTLRRVTDYVVSDCDGWGRFCCCCCQCCSTDSYLGTYYRTNKDNVGLCPAGTVVKALEHKMQVQKHSFPSAGSPQMFVSFICTPRGWLKVCESRSKIDAQHWTAFPMSSTEPVILAAGGGRLESTDNSWVGFQQFQPKAYQTLRLLALGLPALYIAVYCATQVADPDWVASHPYSAHVGLGMMLYFVCVRCLGNWELAQEARNAEVNDPALGIEVLRGETWRRRSPSV